MFNRELIKFENSLRIWLKVRYGRIALFNIIILMLVLLRSAGYFEPFFPISINFIVLTVFFLSVVLLGLGSRFMFIAAFVFWFLAGFIKVAGIDIWAERTAIYAFQTLVLGVLLLIFEVLKNTRLFLKF